MYTHMSKCKNKQKKKTGNQTQGLTLAIVKSVVSMLLTHPGTLQLCNLSTSVPSFDFPGYYVLRNSVKSGWPVPIPVPMGHHPHQSHKYYSFLFQMKT
jgi:hypothetical protein